MRIAVADIGGTNARFALAEVAVGKVVSLGDPVVLAALPYVLGTELPRAPRGVNC